MSEKQDGLGVVEDISAVVGLLSFAAIIIGAVGGVLSIIWDADELVRWFLTAIVVGAAGFALGVMGSRFVKFSRQDFT